MVIPGVKTFCPGSRGLTFRPEALPFFSDLGMDLDQFIFKDKIQAPQSFQGIDRLQQILFFFQRQKQMGGDDIRNPSGAVFTEGRDDRIEVGMLTEFKIILEESQTRSSRSLGFFHCPSRSLSFPWPALDKKDMCSDTR